MNDNFIYFLLPIVCCYYCCLKMPETINMEIKTLIIDYSMHSMYIQTIRFMHCIEQSHKIDYI